LLYLIDHTERYKVMRTEANSASVQASAQHDEAMSAERVVQLIEEMLDLKIQQLLESRMKCPPEIAPMMQAKRQTDQRRLDQIRAELVRLIQA